MIFVSFQKINEMCNSSLLFKNSVSLLLMAFFTFFLHAQEDTELKFPDAYFGKYKGTLHIATTNGNQTYPMEFHLLPSDTISRYQYTIVYGEGEQRQERRYTLIEKNTEKGEYIVDENNGIILDEKVIENRMYALFEVQGTLLTTFITFEEDHLIFEIIATQTKNKNISGGQDEATPEVISYPISTVQRARLIKQ
jgi:hypothetical protein